MNRPALQERAWLSAGVAGRPHGLDGSFYVNRPKPQLLPLGGLVLIGGAELRIVRRAGTDRRPILRLEGCEDRPAAETLRGLELLVARADAPELEPEEWWAEDLEGCRVHDRGRSVGRVRRLLALPSCEVLEVERDDCGELLLIPLVVDAVRSVDPQVREIEVDLGFLGEE